mmetsp:Transcript_383/g.1502  ORF Transcript_383/g.1502 Transcript_383/m.1502 type:complete len:278 (-) Transcript_383:465-1298(-)
MLERGDAQLLRRQLLLGARVQLCVARSLLARAGQFGTLALLGGLGALKGGVGFGPLVGEPRDLVPEGVGRGLQLVRGGLGVLRGLLGDLKFVYHAGELEICGGALVACSGERRLQLPQAPGRGIARGSRRAQLVLRGLEGVALRAHRCAEAHELALERQHLRMRLVLHRAIHVLRFRAEVLDGGQLVARRFGRELRLVGARRLLLEALPALGRVALVRRQLVRRRPELLLHCRQGLFRGGGALVGLLDRLAESGVAGLERPVGRLQTGLEHAHVCEL